MGYLSEISLENFRNYQNLTLSFKSGLNILVGENGQGKSNLLEAVYFLSLLRSFRCSNVQNLKQWKNNYFKIHGIIKQKDRLDDNLEIVYSEKRTLKINNSPLTKSSEFIKRLNAVSFAPEDIDLIKSGAIYRRQFLDIFLSQISPSYLNHLQIYNKAIKARNALIRQANENQEFNPTLFATYDKMLISSGTFITNERIKMLEIFEVKIRHFTKLMFPEGDKLKLVYQSSITKLTENEKISEDLYKEKLTLSYKSDLNNGATKFGPHRDDLLVLLNGKSLISFGSEGQCRLASLVLKISSAEQLIDNSSTENVILLIDDVLGELDEFRREAFLKTILRGDQIFVACTEIPNYLKDIPHQAFKVESGNIIPLS